MKTHTNLYRSQRSDYQMNRDIHTDRNEDMDGPPWIYREMRKQVDLGRSRDGLTMTAITQPRTGITQNDCDICTPQEDPIRPKWSDREERESIEYRQSWDSLAMPDNTQPGRSTSLKDRDICTQREDLRRPHTTCGDSREYATHSTREQVESGHSWDSLAMPTNTQLGRSTSLKDRDICTQRQGPRRTQTTCRDNREYATHASREQVESGRSWDSLAMPNNTQPGTVTSRKDRDICTQRDGLAMPTNTQPGTVTSRRDIEEQVETRHSWDSLATYTPPTSQPVTANWVDRQPQKHIPKTHNSTTTQSIQLTNPRTPNSHHLLLKDRASTETSHIQNWQITHSIPNYQHARIVQPRKVSGPYTKTRMLHPVTNPPSFYQGTPLFLSR